MCLLAGCAQLSSTQPAAASSTGSNTAAVAVYAVGAGGVPVRDAVVTLRPAHATGSALTATEAVPVVVDLIDKQFEPRIVPVRSGSSVTFKNLDDVGHQVYSFSASKAFSIKLASGESSSVPDFGKPGVVILGCKIHNEMIGYLYVTDAPYFGKTDSNGFMRIAGVAPGDYRLGVWRAAVEQDAPALQRSVTLRADEEQVIRLRL